MIHGLVHLQCNSLALCFSLCLRVCNPLPTALGALRASASPSWEVWSGLLSLRHWHFSQMLGHTHYLDLWVFLHQRLRHPMVNGTPEKQNHHYKIEKTMKLKKGSFELEGGGVGRGLESGRDTPRCVMLCNGAL